MPETNYFWVEIEDNVIEARALADQHAQAWAAKR